MSPLTPPATAPRTDREQLARVCDSLRGKLQFMDYLVRAAVADVDRFEAEPDPGTRRFLRQLIEMHTSNLALEGENMRLLDELCHTIEGLLGPDRFDPLDSDHAGDDV